MSENTLGVCSLIVIAAFVSAVHFYEPPSSGAVADDDQRHCTHMGCESQFTLMAALPVPFETLHALHLQVCRNTECVEGSLAGMTERPPALAVKVVSFPDPPTAQAAKHASVTLSVIANETGDLHLEVAYLPWSTADLRDGDWLHVRLSDGARGTVLSFGRALDFTEQAPNGIQCGPICQFAKVDLRNGD